MHIWGDKSVDWDGIDAAAAYIGEGLKKWGRVDVHQYKEMFGEVRVYCSLGLFRWPQLTHPGWHINQWPKWTWKYQSKPAWIFKLLNKLIVPYHIWLYKRYYRKAVEKWPHLKAEILSIPDYGEFLKDI